MLTKLKKPSSNQGQSRQYRIKSSKKSKNPPSNQGQSRQYRIKSSKKLKRLLIKSKNPQPMIRRSKKKKFFVKVLKQKLKQRLKQKQKKRLD